ncbi:MAG: hypothetical protein N3E51_04080 [Candidatus Micrarchaeota archaeon]|nr:hypothetical protein [Candidatus Micrarchaeota archaeon]
MNLGVYQECMKNKKLVAKVLLPLIEFEFSLVGDDSPTLLQSVSNVDQLKTVFEICQRHNWTNTKKLLKKGNNLYFRLTANGLREIYRIAGPFIKSQRNDWTLLITERAGKKGGYQVGKQPTDKKIAKLMKKEPKKWWSVGEVCLRLKLTSSTIRKSFLKMHMHGLVERKRVGNAILLKLK